MIKSLLLKSVASFDETGIQIDNLNKVNFIYGANGTGKTTISNLISNPDDLKFEKCKVYWENDLPIKALVYNKDFRNKYFNSSEIDGVFTLGKATKEELEAIEIKEKKLKEIESNGIHNKSNIEIIIINKENEINDFKDIVWDSIFKNFKEKFYDAFKGIRNKKSSFYDKLIFEYKNNDSELVHENDLEIRADTLFAEELVKFDVIPKPDSNNFDSIESDEIWNKKIIGSGDVEIAKLIQKLDMNDWISKGRNYLQENGICPFCQKETIDRNFRDQIEQFFNEGYTESINTIEKFKEEYIRSSSNIIELYSSIIVKEKVTSNSKIDLKQFATLVEAYKSAVGGNIELIKSKSKEPSREIHLNSSNMIHNKICDIIDKANNEISRHNTYLRDFHKQKIKLINEIWKYILNENDKMISTHIKKIEGLDDSYKKLKEKKDQLTHSFKELRKEIIELQKNVTSVQPTINKINSMLKGYGITNFSIEKSRNIPNKYQILRDNGELAHQTLSEGEITFITFLYFLQLAVGGRSEEDTHGDRIVIIDDPISSLDSNYLFVVSSEIKELLNDIRKNEGNIKQCIVLTHNVYFHKEVSYLDSRTEKLKNTFYWIIRKPMKYTSVKFFKMENPIMSSYELLWQELKIIGDSNGIVIQNIMRRILENYFKILGKYNDEKLIHQFDNIEEQKICRSLLYWLNDGSHSIADDLFIEPSENTVENYKEVFKQIFNKSGHNAHYNMMMKIENVENNTPEPS